MMVTREDIEAFLDRLSGDGANYKEIEPGLWKVRPSGKLEVDFIVHHNPPVVVIRVKVMELPDSNGSSPGLYRRLLELNATDLVHGSYGISDGAIVLTEALELAHLRSEERRVGKEWRSRWAR